MQLTNRTYNILKFVALVLLPGISSAYFGLSQVWGLPNSEKVVGTIAIIDTLLGALLKASSSQYKKTGSDTDGDLIIHEVDGERYLGLGVDRKSFAGIPSKEIVKLRVVDRSDAPTD